MVTFSSEKVWRTSETTSMMELLKHISFFWLWVWREKPSRSETILRQNLACFSMICRSWCIWPSAGTSSCSSCA